jgi:uncharacterized hydrophobic protein (TIGR00341 family)
MPLMNLFVEYDKKKAKRRAIEDLIDTSSHNKDFYVLLVGAVILAIGGIFADSIPVLIASMIVAPLAYPILAIGLGITVGDWRLVGRVTMLFGVSCVIALAIAMLAAVLFDADRVKDVYITFTGNRYLAVVVALVAGAIAAYGMIRPKVASVITGVAIAVSLMPPLVATGVGYASGDTTLGGDALIVFLLNIAGILLASVAVFTILGMRKEYKKIKRIGKH